MGRNLQLILTETMNSTRAWCRLPPSRASDLAVVPLWNPLIQCIKEVDNERMLQVIYLAHRYESWRLDAVSGHVDVFDYFPAKEKCLVFHII